MYYSKNRVDNFSTFTKYENRAHLWNQFFSAYFCVRNIRKIVPNLISTWSICACVMSGRSYFVNFLFHDNSKELAPIAYKFTWILKFERVFLILLSILAMMCQKLSFVGTIVLLVQLRQNSFSFSYVYRNFLKTIINK